MTWRPKVDILIPTAKLPRGTVIIVGPKDDQPVDLADQVRIGWSVVRDRGYPPVGPDSGPGLTL
jgi:hypothetical protein